MTDAVMALDAEKRDELCRLRPEAALALGAPLPETWSAAAPTDVLEVMKAWQNARSALTRGNIAPRDRALYEVDDRVLAAQTEALTFEIDAGLHQGDPDEVGDSLWALMEHALRDRHTALGATLGGRIDALTTQLGAAGGAAACDPYLKERAVVVARSAAPLLQFIERSASTDISAPAAALRAALDAYSGRLNDTATRAEARTLGREKTDALLALRGFDLKCDDIKDVARDTIEQLRMEQVRICRRAFKKAPVSQVLQTVRSQAPYSVEEAAAWAQELATKTRGFVTERGYFDEDFGERKVIPGDSSLHILGRSAIVLPPRGPGDLSTGILILSGLSDDELGHLSVADLENIVARTLDPGHARAAAYRMSAGPLRRGSLCGHASRLAGLIGDETDAGWTYFATQLMREAGFRESAAARFVLARGLEHQAVRAWYDVSLSAGDLSVDEVAAGLERDTDLDAHGARRAALSMYRTPTRAAGRLMGRIRVAQVRRGARIRWRHGYSDRRLHELIVAAGPAPVSLLFGLFDLFSPFNADEGTVEVSQLAGSDDTPPTP